MASLPTSPTRPDTRAPGSRVVVVGIGLVAALAWGYLAWMAWGMAHMDVAVDWLLMPRMTGWQAADAGLVFLMWAIMMAAMMLPSAAPMLVLLGRIRHANAMAAAGGYLAAWVGFSVLATLAQWALLELRLVTPMMESASPVMSALLLAAAGAWQFTATKHGCLVQCRPPIGALLAAAGTGAAGAWRLGLRQGAYCVGCCGLLMALLFVLGVMNLVWIVVLTAVVLVEKSLRRPRWFVRLLGTALLGWASLLVAVAVMR